MNEGMFEVLSLNTEDMKYITGVQFHDAIGVFVDDDGSESHGSLPVMVVRWCTHDEIMKEEGEGRIETFLLPPETWMTLLSAEMLEYASGKFSEEKKEVNDE
jgi:hypothetical protein